jgi:hypothetical protein
MLVRAGVGREHVTPFHLFWFDGDGDEAQIESLPKAALFKRINVAFLRSGWNDPNAAFVGFKGGNNGASHAHLDLGTFVYDVDGLRWANDLGSDDYNLPGYFGSHRWDYYRLRTEGHNTLTLNGEQQPPKATAAIAGFGDSPDQLFAIADLSAGYPAAQSVRRGVRLIGKSLLVQDELQLKAPTDVTWHLHTPAKIRIDEGGRVASLSQAGKKLTARLIAPVNASFMTAPSDVPPTTRSTVPRERDEHRSAGEKLIVQLHRPSGDVRVVVVLSSSAEMENSRSIRPLDAWGKR